MMQNQNGKTVIVSQMETRRNLSWDQSVLGSKNRNSKHKRLLKRYPMLFAAASLCFGLGGILAYANSEKTQSVMSHLTAGFEYDKTLGRLQFVSNLLPESAMVFMENNGSDQPDEIVPSGAQTIHAWSQAEPWLEYHCVGAIRACQDGQIMTVIQNRDDEFTVRVGHQNGYESVYSGLHAVQVKEFETVSKGQQIGTATGFTAFEWRKDGLSVLPVFASASEI